MTARISHWIDGKSWAGVAERTGEVFDPATGEVRALVDFAGDRQVADVVAAAARAFPCWPDSSLAVRSRVLFALRELLSARKDELARIITAEHGKVESDAAGEVARAISGT